MLTLQWNSKTIETSIDVNKNYICEVFPSGEHESNFRFKMKDHVTMKLVQTMRGTKLKVQKTSIQVDNETQGEILSIIP